MQDKWNIGTNIAVLACRGSKTVLAKEEERKDIERCLKNKRVFESVDLKTTKRKEGKEKIWTPRCKETNPPDGQK